MKNVSLRVAILTLFGIMLAACGETSRDAAAGTGGTTEGGGDDANQGGSGGGGFADDDEQSYGGEQSHGGEQGQSCVVDGETYPSGSVIQKSECTSCLCDDGVVHYCTGAC